MSHNLDNNFLTINLVRHAQSVNNTFAANLRKSCATLEEYWKQFDEVRVADPALSEKGVNQASTLAAHLAKVEINRPLRLFCSPLHRSIHTAQHLSTSLGVAPELWADIFEEGGFYIAKDPSVRSGKTIAEIEALGVKIPSDFKKGTIAHATDEGWWNHDRETHEECIARAHAVLNKFKELANFYAGQKMTLWLVSHGDFLSVFLGVLLKIDLSSHTHKDLYFYHDNCGVTQFSINGSGEVKVAFVNRHLAPFAEAPTDSPAHAPPPKKSNSPL